MRTFIETVLLLVAAWAISYMCIPISPFLTFIYFPLAIYIARKRHKNRKFKNLFAKADSHLEAGEYSEAKKLYEEAKWIREKDPYPEQQLQVIEQNEFEEMVAKYGKENAEAIKKKEVIIGMDSEMVQKSVGKPIEAVQDIHYYKNRK